MSTRYVWGKYGTIPVVSRNPDSYWAGIRGLPGAENLDEPMGYCVVYKNINDVTLNGSYIQVTGGTALYDNSIGKFAPIPANSIFFYSEDEKTTTSVFLNDVLCSPPDRTSSVDVSEYKDHYWMTANWTYLPTISNKKGDLQSYVSSSVDGQYPQDGVSGNSWYTEQGSDNIDASAVSIPSTIMGGTQITITVTPGTGKVYAGTVSYIYQVKLGSGSWTTIATTTATTRTYTVPYGTESIQVRVQAKDDIGFTSSDYVTSSAVTVINNQPPTAPGSIEVTNVVSGQQCTITITAATDPDGTVESYIYERSVDGSAWQQIANVNALTYNDTINAEWGTVAYRVKAVDDDGDSGPYVTSQTSVVNSGWVIISGPANDMGDKPAPFEFELSVSISGQETSDNITVDVTLDGQSVYSQAVAPNTPISIDVDTRTMRTGSHSFAVAATCDTYVPASGEYTFTVPEITIPDGGRMDRLEGQDGETIFPITLARAVAGLENYGVESKVHPGAYTGTGTFGTDNPNSLEFEFEPKMVLIQGTAGRVAILIKPSGVGVSIGPNESTTLNVTWQGKSVSWYNALNAANQMNTENETYSYTAFG